MISKELINDRASNLMLATKIMGSKEFLNYVKAEAELIGKVWSECESGNEQHDMAFFDEVLVALGRCVNKSLTFKLVPKS